MQPHHPVPQPTNATRFPARKRWRAFREGPMKYNRSWISLIGTCVLTAIGAAIAFAIIGAAGSAALADRQSPDPASEQAQLTSPAAPQTPAGEIYQGVVTDSRCGARHMKNSRLNPTECARLCVRQGASYVLVDGNRRYKLVGNAEALERFAGQRIRVSGTRQGETIQVSSANSLF